MEYGENRVITDSSLLLEETPMFIFPSLLKFCTLFEAAILQQISYWIRIYSKKGKNYINGRTWVYISNNELAKQIKSCSVKTVNRSIKKLEEKGLVLSDNFNRNSRDRVKWYAIDYVKLQSLLGEGIAVRQPVQFEQDNLSNSLYKNKRKLKNEYTQMDNIQNNHPHVTIIEFIEIYQNEIYPDYIKKEHYTLTDVQRGSVYDNLLYFSVEYLGLDDKKYDVFQEEIVEYLSVMANLFLRNIRNSDFSIIHFSQKDILVNRYHEYFRKLDNDYLNKE